MRWKPAGDRLRKDSRTKFTDICASIVHARDGFAWHASCTAKRMRVLVVDESEERAAVLRDGLAHAGHEVIASLSSPLELLRAVDELAPDVIVIDTE